MPDEPKWLAIARAEIGQHEAAGGVDNPRILEYLASVGLRTHDETPWCGAFVAWVLKQCGIEGPKNSAGGWSGAWAPAWAWWGSPCGQRLGAITVVQRKDPGADAKTGSSSGSHVGFLAAVGPNYIELLGGNQGDSVKLSKFPSANYRVMATRWPKGQI